MERLLRTGPGPFGVDGYEGVEPGVHGFDAGEIIVHRFERRHPTVYQFVTKGGE